MKKNQLLFVLLVLLLPVLLFGGTGKFDWDPIIGLAGIVLVPILAQLTKKLFRKLDIDVDTATLEAAFAEAWKLISQVEMLYKKGEIQPDKRHSFVVDRIHASLPAKTIKVVEKRFGSVDNFVEAAFQHSAVASKGGK